VGVYSDGFIHAGNLAYLALISLFPFFIVLAWLAHTFGHSADTADAIYSFLRTVPLSVRDFLRQPIDEVLKQRTGALLWIGGLVGLWTTGSFIETIRDILRRAYGLRFSKPFWHYRLASAALVIGAVILMLAAFSAQLFLTGVANFLDRIMPASNDVIGWIGWTRLAPLAALFAALYLIFYSLTPSKYRWTKCPKWPGAAFTAVCIPANCVKKSVTAETSQLHHVRPYSHFKRPVEANTVGNTMTLCIDCHERKTELDRERESRMR